MTINVTILAHTGRISLSDTFDFKVYRDFRNAYIPLLGNIALREIEIEMSQVKFLDSSALGMLMLLNERAKDVNIIVTLLNASAVLPQLLEVANFSKVFDLKGLHS